MPGGYSAVPPGCSRRVPGCLVPVIPPGVACRVIDVNCSWCSWWCTHLASLNAKYNLIGSENKQRVQITLPASIMIDLYRLWTSYEKGNKIAISPNLPLKKTKHMYVCWASERDAAIVGCQFSAPNFVSARSLILFAPTPVCLLSLRPFPHNNNNLADCLPKSS